MVLKTNFKRSDENSQDPLNENFTEIENYIEDTGWVSLTLTADFKAYSAYPTNAPKIRRIGKTVYASGYVTPTRTIAGSEQVSIATLPTDFTPKYPFLLRMQGTGMSTWLCEVTLDGQLKFSRYGKTDYLDAASGVFLPISINYPID